MKNRRLITRLECEMRRRVGDKSYKANVELDQLYHARTMVLEDYVKELEKELITIKLKGRYARHAK